MPEDDLLPLGAEKIRVLCVDDQVIVGECVRRMVEQEPDMVFAFCSEGEQIFDVVGRFAPTVILLDLLMPDIDGLTVLRDIRAQKSIQNIPVIVCSSTEDANVKYRSFALGANDYIVKLPDPLELIARIRSHGRAYQLRQERDRTYVALVESQAALKSELDEAERYVKSLLPPKLDSALFATDWIHRSSSRLGGDAFGYHFIDDAHFAIYLLDVCGHGVGAALLSVSVINALRSGNVLDADVREPAQVLVALNRMFNMERQNQKYFTLWYGVWHLPSRQLKYASGGHPPAVLVQSDGSFAELTTRGAIVGALENIEYTQLTIDIPEESRLYIFSDGVYEIEDASSGKLYTLGAFKQQLLAPCVGSKVASLLVWCQNIQGQDNFTDDYSLLEVQFKVLPCDSSTSTSSVRSKN